MLDEKDLLGPLPPSACSSLDDGPYCARLGLAGTSMARGSGEAAGGAAAPSFLSRGDVAGPASARYVVDGVLSSWMQAQNKEAFDWNEDTTRTFSNLVSRVISDSLSSQQVSGPSGRSSTPMSRTGSQCFRLSLDRLAPWRRYLPSNFSAGLPRAIAASWEGLWEVEATDLPRSAHPSVRGSAGTSGSRRGLEVAPRPPWATQVVLRTALGYIRFAQPLVVRRLLLGVPSVSEVGELWGRGSLVCGRLLGREQWCVALDQVAASARGPRVDGEDGAHEGLHYVDVGDSIHAVDEVAFVAAPAPGLAVGLVEVMATLPSHPMHGLPDKRRIVLLRRPRGKEQGGSAVQPTLAVVSRDAAVWDMNEVLRHHMQLRLPGPGRRAAAAAKSGGPAQKELKSFQEMLQGLKAGKVGPPRGVSFARLKREVAALVAATKEIQDDDVLLHGKMDSLLQQRLREKSLDGLLALQAAWRLRPDAATGSPASEAQASSEHGQVAEGTGERWADDAAEAMDHASEALQRKAAEAREKSKKKKAGALEFQMDLGGSTIELHLANGVTKLQDLARQVRDLSSAMLGGKAPPSSTADEGAEEEGGSEAVPAPDEEAEPEDDASPDREPAALDSDQMAANLQRLLGAALKQAGVASEGIVSEALSEEAMQEVLQPLQQAMTENAQADSEGNPMKMQVHLVNLEDLANGEANPMAQIMQSLLGQQGGGGGGGVFGGDALQSLLQAHQAAAAGVNGGAEDEQEEAAEVVPL